LQTLDFQIHKNINKTDKSINSW